MYRTSGSTHVHVFVSEVPSRSGQSKTAELRLLATGPPSCVWERMTYADFSTSQLCFTRLVSIYNSGAPWRDSGCHSNGCVKSLWRRFICNTNRKKMEATVNLPFGLWLLSEGSREERRAAEGSHSYSTQPPNSETSGLPCRTTVCFIFLRDTD